MSGPVDTFHHPEADTEASTSATQTAGAAPADARRKRTRKPSPLRNAIAAVERRVVAEALIEHGYNRSHTAKALGVSRRSLISKIAKLELKTPQACQRAITE